MPRLRQLLCLACVLVVAACSAGPGTLGIGYDPNKGLVMGNPNSSSGGASAQSDSSGGLSLGGLFGPSSGSADQGYAVGDEPYAVKAGADILAQGGSAADAATAMYFAMAVTYPGAAGLGGGGMCLVYNPADGQSGAIDFLARNAAGGGAYAVPGNVRGFATLQDRYGALPWARDIAYAEALAGSGFPISDALDARLKAAQNVVRLDAGLAAEFLDESGQVKPAGTLVTNPDLSQTLSTIREKGAAAFYDGALARRIIAYSAGEDGKISAADLAAYRAHMHAPQVVNVDGLRAYLPPASIGAGSFAAALMSRLVDAQGLATGRDPEAAVRAAVAATLARFGVKNLPADLGATGFAVRDKYGEGVACAVTMNGPFGSGHTVPGTGITLAASPSAGQTGLAAAFLTPVLATRDDSGPIVLPGDEGSGTVTLAGAGAGGPNGTAAIADALLRLGAGADMTRPHALHVASAGRYDTVNAIICQHGICSVLPDTEAHGLGAAAGG